MSFPVINLVKTGNNIKRIAKENGYSADKIRDMLGISDRSNVYKWYVEKYSQLSTIFLP